MKISGNMLEIVAAGFWRFPEVSIGFWRFPDNPSFTDYLEHICIYIYMYICLLDFNSRGINGTKPGQDSKKYF